MLATMLHGMEGTPYIYQGEELGMTNIKLRRDQYDDVEIHNLFRDRLAQGYREEDILAAVHLRGRDNARTPMQWNPGPNAGFTTGKPWLPVNENHGYINAEAALANPDSVFHYYRRLIALRKEMPIFRDGDFRLVDKDNPKVFAYERRWENKRMLVVCNFTAEDLPWDLPDQFQGARCLLANYPQDRAGLRPYEAAMYYIED